MDPATRSCPDPMNHAARSWWALALALLIAVLAWPVTGTAQDRSVVSDVLNLSGSASAEAAPDLAVVTMTVVRDGADSASLTQDIEQVMTRALADAKSVTAVTAASGGFSTNPHYDSKGARTSWQVRAELILRSRDFVALGKLAGKLSAPTDGLQITSSGFEVSPELRQDVETELVERAIANFKARAAQASRALGYAGYTLREVTVGQAQLSGGPHPMPIRMMAAASSSPSVALPLESGRATLQLEVHGSVQMHH